jgi:hypothetical protein
MSSPAISSMALSTERRYVPFSKRDIIDTHTHTLSLSHLPRHQFIRGILNFSVCVAIGHWTTDPASIVARPVQAPRSLFVTFLSRSHAPILAHVFSFSTRKAKRLSFLGGGQAGPCWTFSARADRGHPQRPALLPSRASFGPRLPLSRRTTRGRPSSRRKRAKTSPISPQTCVFAFIRYC